MTILERLSKTAAIASALALVVLQLAVHPDITLPLRIVAAAAFVAGWATGRAPRAMALWTALLVVSPAVLRAVAGREGPVLDLVPLAALAGALARGVPWSRWQLPPLWALPIGGWALTLALGWPVIVAREAGFEASGLVNTSAITSWTLLSAAQSIAWITSVALVQLLALLWFDWVFAETRSTGRPPAAVHGLWIGITVASLVALVQGFVDWGFLTTDAWAQDQRATGTMLDANAFGAAAAVAAVVGFVAIKAGLVPGGWPVAALVLGANLLGAWLSASRTMLLIDVVGLGGMFAGLARQRRDRAGRGFWLAAGATAAALVIVPLMTANSGPLRRLFDMPGGVSEGRPSARAFLAEVLWIRGGYGSVSHQILREYPLTGVGVGSFHYVVADYYREISQDDGLPFDNAQNWWRHELVELGILGGAAPIFWSLLVAWSVLTPSRSAAARGAVAGQASQSPVGDFALRGLLLGVGLCSLTGVPTQNAVMQFAFLAVLAWLIAPHARQKEPASPGPALRAGWVILAVFAVAYASGHLLLATGSLDATARAARFQRQYIGGGYGLERDEEGTPFNWTDDATTFVLPRTDPWLMLRLWADHPDAAEQPVDVTLSAQCGKFFETTFSGRQRITLGIEVPETYRAVELHVATSRTWRPLDHGISDPRRLGVAVVHGFTDEATGRVADRVLALPDCSALH